MIPARLGQIPISSLAQKRRGYSAIDLDAAAYISRVETADGQPLEDSIKLEIDLLVQDLKSKSLWTPIKSAFLLRGPRTLAGASVPLVGVAPVISNFVSGQYNRIRLKSTGTNELFDTTRLHQSDPQNSRHYSVWLKEPYVSTGVNHRFWSAGSASSGSRIFALSPSDSFSLAVTNTPDTLTGINATTYSDTFIGSKRANSSEIVLQAGATSNSYASASSAPSTGSTFFFGRPGGNFTNAGFSWLSHGEDINLSLLRTTLSTYMSNVSAILSP